MRVLEPEPQPFSQLYDTAAMCSVFQGLPEFADKPIRHCHLVSVRQRLKLGETHKSSQLVCYQLELATGESERLYLKAFASGRSAKYRRSRPNGLTHLPELDAILWRFPHDPSLPQLPQLVNAEEVKTVLPFEHLPAEFASPNDLTVKVEPVRYKPEDRCTTRDVLTGEKGSLTLFTKTFKDERGQRLHEDLLKLWCWSSQPSTQFHLTQPLAYDMALKTLWQAALPGNPPTSAHITDTRFLEAVAKGLAQLHESGPVSIKMRTVDAYLTEARKMCGALKQRLPQLNSLLQNLMMELEQQSLALAPLPQKPIHGAFRLKQLLLDGEHLGVVDFDSFALGDPCEDVADFVVDIEELKGDAAQRAVRGFLEAYRTSVSWSLETLGWHLALKGLKRAYWLRYRLGIQAEQEADIKRLLTLAHERIVSKASA